MATMAKSRRLHPQFFHTLVNGYHNYLTIPLDFFSKYIEGRNVEKQTAEVKSDTWDLTWNVKMTGRRLSAGWEEFAVAHDFQIGDFVLVRYEGDMVFYVSDLGPNWCEIQDIPFQSFNNYGQYDIGKILLKKRLYPRTQVDFSSNDVDGRDDNEDNMEFSRKKKVKNNSPEAEAVFSPSLDDSCFVAVVTASSLRTDKLYLPQHFTNSNGLTRNCRKIVIIDGGERSWLLDLRFHESSDAFYISRGWRSFCDENGQKAEGFFILKLVGNGETPVLSFCLKESINDMNQRDCCEASERESLSIDLSNEEENIEEERRSQEREKNHLRWRDSTPSNQKQFVTLTITPYSVKKCILRLPKKFTRENDINKPGMVTLLGKDGTKQQTKLLLEKASGVMTLGNGWKDFVIANGLKTGDSFTLKLKWEDKAPVLSLTPSSQNEFVTLTITPFCVQKCILRLPKKFTRENDMNKPGMVTLLGKDGIKQQTKLLVEKVSGVMSLGNGWKDFAIANGLNIGDSFTLKLIWEDTTPVLCLFSVECSIDRGWCSEANLEKSLPIDNTKEKSNLEERSKAKTIKEANNIEQSIKEESCLWERCIDSTSSSQNRFVTLTLTHEDVRACKLHLPNQFMRDNGINKLGKMTILGVNGIEFSAYLLSRDGTVALENGWEEFCEANGVKLGESFTLEFVNEQDNTTPVLRFCSR